MIKCPVCGGELGKFGWRRRKHFEMDGGAKVLRVRRLRCKKCGKIHHELPDILFPYKRHCAATIENIIGGNDSGVCCEESTIRRIRRWWETLEIYFKGVRDALSAKHCVAFSDPLQPKEIVHAVANAHLWASTRSAFLSG